MKYWLRYQGIRDSGLNLPEALSEIDKNKDVYITPEEFERLIDSMKVPIAYDEKRELMTCWIKIRMEGWVM